MTTPIHTFSFPATIRFGFGASEELPDYLVSQGIARPLIVTDGNIATLEFFRRIIDNIDGRKIPGHVFSDIHKNPVKSDVYKGTDAYDQGECDAIIGIGGGAALDVARAIVLRVNHREDLFKYNDLTGGSRFITNDVPHFVTIPTTAGTGSEVGRSAIIADDETHAKKILFSPRLLARMVFADPELTMELPPAVTAATGMDALTHNMEAYLARNYHPLCDGIALEGIALIGRSLQKAVLDPDPDCRSNMLMASLMGAAAFQKGLGVVHSLAHPLSTLLDTHHGLANAIMIPVGMEFNTPGNEFRFKRIARALSLRKESGKGVVDYLRVLNEQIGIPARLSGIGVREDHIGTLSELALADFCHPDNPIPVTRDDFKSMYEQTL